MAILHIIILMVCTSAPLMKSCVGLYGHVQLRIISTEIVETYVFHLLSKFVLIVCFSENRGTGLLTYFFFVANSKLHMVFSKLIVSTGKQRSICIMTASILSLFPFK